VKLIDQAQWRDDRWTISTETVYWYAGFSERKRKKLLKWFCRKLRGQDLYVNQASAYLDIEQVFDEAAWKI